MYIVGIAGGSGSGKTTFVNKIVERLKPLKVGTIHMDSYYLHAPPMHLSVHGEKNFDHPDAFDWELLRVHLEDARHGKAIQSPVYDFKTSRRLVETESVGPYSAYLIEGIYALWDASVRSLFDQRIFLNVDADIRFIRRLHRDVRERGRSLDGIIRQYYDTVRPMHHEYLEPTSQFADVIVGEQNDNAADLIASQLRWVIQGSQSNHAS